MKYIKTLFNQLLLVLIFFASTGLCPGQSWEAKDAALPGSLYGDNVFAINESVAWTYAFEADELNNFTFLNSAISIITDGGSSWQSVPFPTNDRFYTTSMWALNSEIAWLTGVSQETTEDSINYLFKTIDGGQNWNRIPVPLQVFIDFVYMWNENEGIIVGDPDLIGFEIYKTQDGGLTWERIDNIPPALPNEWGIWKDNYTAYGNDLWTATTLGRIYHTADKGESWEVLDAPLNTNTAWSMDVNTDGDIYITYTEYLPAIQKDVFQIYRKDASGGDWMNITGKNDKYLLRDISVIPYTNTVLISLEAKNHETRISYDKGNSWITIDTISRVNFMDFYNASAGYASQANLGLDFSDTEMYTFTGSPLSGIIGHKPLQDVNIEITPNPTSDYIIITLKADQLQDYYIILNDPAGKLILKQEFNNVTEIHSNMDMQKLPPGNYILTIANKNGIFSEKVIKSKN